MLIKTRRFEIEINRDSLYLRITAFGKTFATFRDFSGADLSATDWLRDAKLAQTIGTNDKSDAAS